MIWQDSAPSNIALIKYMGKEDVSKNLATNPSLSYTLEHLRTFVTVECIESSEDKWQALQQQEILPFSLSEKGRQRVLNYIDKLKQLFNYQGTFLIRTGNNFPSDCGLASSASSYAAITKVMVHALCELTQTPYMSLFEQAHLSRQASGSSGRSFFGPWCVWDGEHLAEMQLPYKQLVHQVIVVEREKKEVSSSEAHIRVASSHLFAGRPERSRKLLNELLQALTNSDWESAYQICWAEFWDMHALFETSRPAFGYMTPASLEVLSYIRKRWQQEKIGPIVTMDAGPNIHLLYPFDMKEMALSVQKDLEKKFLVIMG